TLERIFRFPKKLGYGFDNDSPPRATDIRTGCPRRRGSTPAGTHEGAPDERHTPSGIRGSAHPSAQEPEREADGDPRGHPDLDRPARLSAEHARDRRRRGPEVALQRHAPAGPVGA